jgi:hypothetical protein
LGEGPLGNAPEKVLGERGIIHGTNTGLRSAAESYSYVAIGTAAPPLERDERDERDEADPGPSPFLDKCLLYEPDTRGHSITTDGVT